MMFDKIESKLLKALQPFYLKVENESCRHNVPAGSETHFKVIIVSDSFAGERLLQRHRQVYNILSEELSLMVHAVALHTYTTKEWEYLKSSPIASPPCFGGGIAH
jgi:BolA protein